MTKKSWTYLLGYTVLCMLDIPISIRWGGSGIHSGTIIFILIMMFTPIISSLLIALIAGFRTKSYIDKFNSVFPKAIVICGLFVAFYLLTGLIMPGG